jgi:glycosyltransferase involved in cell wall biosynthesis
VGEAIESILAQTLKDFELVISDNASTDNTEEICRRYAEQDKRTRYVRNEKNVGAARNYNRLVEMSRAEYFKWAAHDDMLAPEYLEKCIEVLDRKPSVIVCHTETIYIDENGAEYGVFDDRLDLRSSRPHKRYRGYFFRPYQRCNAIFGVIRRGELRKTPLIGPYLYSDRVLLGELALRGQVYRVPEPLFLRRDHPQQVWRANPTREALQLWFDPTRAGKVRFPHWRLFWEHLMAVMRVPMHWHERLLCLRHLGRWVRKNDGALVRNLLLLDR